jgi:antitoxin (DNA-binding transcriptional repressor) of toxin-antitoxin stability system
MIRVTIHHAKTHLSRLLREVARGETVIILRGDHPIARLEAITASPSEGPKVGEPTSSGVTWTEGALGPLSDDELREWGL